jgi:hypothetical protein
MLMVIDSSLYSTFASHLQLYCYCIIACNPIVICHYLFACQTGHSSCRAPLQTTATTMKGLLVCLLLPVGLAQAVRVYLSPSPSLPSRLSAKQASFALSRHLDLESFETLDENSVIWDTPSHQEFIGQGPKDGLLLTIDESCSHGTFPHLLNSFMRAFVDLTCAGVGSNRRHSEEAQSDVRDPIPLISHFSLLLGLNFPSSSTLYLLPNTLRSVVPRTWCPSIT